MFANGGGPQVGPVSEVDRALERDAVHDDVGGVSLGGKIGETKARRAHTRFVHRRQYSGSTRRALLTRRRIGREPCSAKGSWAKARREARISTCCSRSAPVSCFWSDSGWPGVSATASTGFARPAGSYSR